MTGNTLTTHTDWGGLPEEAVQALEEKVRRAVAQGIAEGIREAFEDEDLTRLAMDRVLAQFQERAHAASGRWLMDGLMSLGKRAAWFVAFGTVIYMAGGWGALVLWIKGGGGSGH